jgi:ABC-2 type transport system ATP-binding protein
VQNSAPAGPVIDVVNMSKSYGDVLAVDRVSLRVEAGEIYALLGLNGAGKTTLIRVLLGMVRPAGGRVALFGATIDRHSHRVWSDVGYLVETPAAYPELTVRENLDVVRRLRRIGDRTVVDDTIERLGLGPYAHRRARTLSLGNAQRLGLAKALLHRPRLLILDEPANGLDPPGWSKSGTCCATSPATERPSFCPATSWPRWRGWPPESASSTPDSCARS